jgi:hypothetical protein
VKQDVCCCTAVGCNAAARRGAQGLHV